MSWFENVENPGLKSIKKATISTPTGVWSKCTSCDEILQNQKLFENARVCPYCEHHFRLSAKERLELLVDAGTFKIHKEELKSSDPLSFVDKKSYSKRLEESDKDPFNNESALVGVAKISGMDVSILVMNFAFMGGSMGAVAGEKVAYAMDLALDLKIPCVVVSASGGARMHEGIISLMQMAKTSATRSKLREEGIPFISILTDPTTGGVAASFAMQGDIHLAEPRALIGFAGPRVIEQSIRQVLPAGFQRSEFLLEHGFIDRVVHRKELKQELSFFIKTLYYSGQNSSSATH